LRRLAKRFAVLVLDRSFVVFAGFERLNLESLWKFLCAYKSKVLNSNLLYKLI